MARLLDNLFPDEQFADVLRQFCDVTEIHVDVLCSVAGERWQPVRFALKHGTKINPRTMDRLADAMLLVVQGEREFEIPDNA